MHVSNSAPENSEITNRLIRVEKLWRRAAARRENPLRDRLQEAVGEIIWDGNNLPYHDAIGRLRQAEIAFANVAKASSVATAMERFTIRPDEPLRRMLAHRSALRAKQAGIQVEVVGLLSAWFSTPSIVAAA